MATARALAIVLESKDVTPAQVGRMIASQLVQCARDFCPRYDLPVPTFRIFDALSDVPAIGWDIIVFLPSSDIANALGYHSETPDGRPFARIFTVGLSLADIEETFSHETLELLLDPSCNRYAMAPNGDLWPIEASDAVQGQRYYIDLGDGSDPVAKADFVCPAFWDSLAPSGSEFNYNKATPIGAPFTLAQPDGYSALLRGGESITQGERKGQQSHAAGRTERRLAAMSIKARRMTLPSDSEIDPSIVIDEAS